MVKRHPGETTDGYRGYRLKYGRPDYLYPQPAEIGETLEATNFAIGCGGKGANQAVAAARMGAKVMMVSKVGDDLFAPETVANLQNGRVWIRASSPLQRAPPAVSRRFLSMTSHRTAF